ncbi:26S proteasome subunit P45 [Trametes versicolor FP-101664 SS1]|uniref:26S proteasome subunit P45 n=1 Tax=Trametes versicolor (strain FP-101664) TaxID=717944 RepID=UPI0004623014|nr:26S proteasome subunit P45 [Trametes versicolor FP-101664 SS1]EIW60671.1 26S proteasome subunit P45 [Trametes versicolor FP-101664 SS1]
MPPKADWEKWEKKDDKEEKEIKPLDDSDIQILKTYGQGPYAARLKKLDQDLKEVQKRINEKLGTFAAMVGVKESDTGLASPNLWDLPADRQRMGEEHPLQVARCTKIIAVDPDAAERARAVNPEGAVQGQKGADEQDKYVINIKQIAKFVVGLGERVAPTDIEEGMRVGVDRNKYQIQIPLPPKIDASVTMMQVEEKPDVTYSDVGGCKEQIEKLREVVETPLLSPERFVNLGIDPPKGVLLFGPPGTGKTLCARAVANRTDATFIRVIGSELVQKYVGEGARMVRELFEMARSKKACIIFFDEVDAIGGARFDDGAGGDNEVQRTMLELINQLDGFDPRGNIKVLMATNRPDTLDPALLRPGRLDRRVEFSLPDAEGRAHILRIHARSMSVERNIRFDLIARLCPNTTGAELRSVATEAGMFAIRARRKVATERDFLDAVEKVVRQGTKFSSTPLYQRRHDFHFNAELSKELALSPTELSRLIEEHAKQPPRPLTLRTLLSLARPLTPESVLKSVEYVFTEIPRRLAMRARSLESLPFIVGMNPFIARTLQAHRRAFQFLIKHPPVKTLEDNARFIEQLAELVQSHANDIPAMAKGFQECARYLTPEQISEFLDSTIRNRIAVRLIAEQHIAISRDLARGENGESGSSHLGVVDPMCSPKEMIGVCGSFVSDLCEATLGASPQIVIDGDADATFAYVPVHLEYILTEVLKNSFRATVEWHQRHHAYSSATPIPPVVITIAAPPHAAASHPAPARYLSLRIRDQGGGVPPANMSRIFSYSFTTAGRGAEGSGSSWDDEGIGGGPYAAQHIGGSAAIDAAGGSGGGHGGGLFAEMAGRGVQMGMGTIAGLGYGLPMSRLYARYFGGSFDFKSLDGWGSDVFIKLRCLDDGRDIEI